MRGCCSNINDLGADAFSALFAAAILTRANRVIMMASLYAHRASLHRVLVGKSFTIYSQYAATLSKSPIKTNRKINCVHSGTNVLISTSLICLVACFRTGALRLRRYTQNPISTANSILSTHIISQFYGGQEARSPK